MELNKDDYRWFALTASHLSAGLVCLTNYDDLLGAWGQGCLELHTELSQYAEPIYDVMVELAYYKNFPGVFHYEVTEDFGAWFAKYIMDNKGAAPSRAQCLETIARLVIGFFAPLEPGEQAAVRAVLENRGWIAPVEPKKIN